MWGPLEQQSCEAVDLGDDIDDVGVVGTFRRSLSNDGSFPPIREGFKDPVASNRSRRLDSNSFSETVPDFSWSDDRSESVVSAIEPS